MWRHQAQLVRCNISESLFHGDVGKHGEGTAFFTSCMSVVELNFCFYHQAVAIAITLTLCSALNTMLAF